jgi:hypothetical protein
MAGVTKNNTILAANVRSISLKAIQDALEDLSPENKEFRRALLIKLAGSVLPRLNEHTGSDGEPIKVNVINYGTTPIQSEVISTTTSGGTAEVQDSGISS